MPALELCAIGVQIFSTGFRGQDWYDTLASVKCTEWADRGMPDGVYPR